MTRGVGSSAVSSWKFQGCESTPALDWLLCHNVKKTYLPTLIRTMHTPGDTTVVDMCFQHRWQVLLGVLLVIAGIVVLTMLTMFELSSIIVTGLAIVCLGLSILMRALCMVIKCGDVPVTGHVLYPPRTGTRYTYHQAIAVQRRLDRIRRATEEDCNAVHLPPPSVTRDPRLPGTLPPWPMEPPPSYETVMKTTTAIDQI